MNRDCNQIRDLIADSVTGPLPAEQSRHLDEHLEQCADCRRYAEALQGEDLLLSQLAAGVAANMPDRKERLVQALGSRRPQRTNHLMQWRGMMRSRMTKLALAAGIVLVILLGLHLGRPLGPSITWADVRDASLAQRWLHMKYDNGNEEWLNLQTGDRFSKDRNGRCVARNHARNAMQRYDPRDGQQIIDTRWRIGGEVPPAWEPKTAWESMIGPLEAIAEYREANDWDDVEIHADQRGGEQLIRFDCYFIDAAGKRFLTRQIWADPKTRLPVTLQDLAGQKDQERFIAATFDFPETGPASIYDLGVPQDLPIVRPYDYDKPVAPSVAAVLEAAKAALERFPARYRAVVWENDRESEVRVTWRDGKKIRYSNYFNLPADLGPPYHLKLPATAQEALLWTQAQTPVDASLCDGERLYQRQFAHPVVGGTSDVGTVMWQYTERDWFDLVVHSTSPMQEQWPYLKWYYEPALLEVIADGPEELTKYIGLRVNRGDTREDFYIDPEHDYLCVRNIPWELRSGQWEKKWEHEYSGFTQLPEGQWHTAKHVQVFYPAPGRNKAARPANWDIDIQVLEETDFPLDTFSGNKLMEGVKLETP